MTDRTSKKNEVRKKNILTHAGVGKKIFSDSNSQIKLPRTTHAGKSQHKGKE